MGTDIHAVFQAKKKNPKYGHKNAWFDLITEVQIELDRHYLLFAWIGNVRNGYGLAGSPSHTLLEPLSDCRGFPDDFYCYEENNYQHCLLPYDDKLWWMRLSVQMGDHSFSWITSTEVIEAADKLSKITRYGIISIDEYHEWDKVSQPKGWSGGIWGKDVLVSEVNEICSETTHVKISWTIFPLEELQYFVNEMKRLHTIYGEVRMVFGFDS